jgi:periplasmic protein TonB
MSRIRLTALLALLLALTFSRPNAVTAQGTQEDDFLKGTVSLKAEGLVKPKVKRQTGPKYTQAAMKLGVQGVVTLQAIIGTDGKVEKVRVKTALYPELDQEAIETVKRWEFEPARLYLEPVRVMVEIEMEFRLGYS